MRYIPNKADDDKDSVSNLGKEYDLNPGIVKKCAVRKHPKSKIGMYQAT